MKFHIIQNVLVIFFTSLTTPSHGIFSPHQSISSPHEEYDFIIVGGGAAGCVLAARLTENPDWKVLLIEAGGEENALYDIPLLPYILPHTKLDWGYKTVKNDSYCGAMLDGQCYFVRGKVLGGSTTLNYMIHTRGNKVDYDTWEQMGNTGWGYDSVLPYFKNYEDMKIPEFINDTTYHSTKGELSINYPSVHTLASKAFLDAIQEVGFKQLDYNAKDWLGFTYIQGELKNGKKDSANRAFLKPVRNRKNLRVITKSTVTKILIDQKTKTAYGVEYKWLNILCLKAYASKEVILSAGAINSPQLLMLSGVGPKEHLDEMGIPVLQDSKVGYNFQEHIGPGNVFFTLNQTVAIPLYNIPFVLSSAVEYLFSKTGYFTITGGVEANGFVDLMGSQNGTADFELMFVGSTLSIDVVGYAWGFDPSNNLQSFPDLGFIDAFQLMPVLLKPHSRGRIVLKSRNPFEYPLIYPNYFSDPRDMDLLLKGVRLAQKIASAPAFQKYGAKVYTRPLNVCKDEKFDSDEYWECSIRNYVMSYIHQVGTCNMGPSSDPDSVVDPTLKVIGIKNLRVIDGSIMPIVPAAHLTAPVYMVAEKGADMIKNEHMND